MRKIIALLILIGAIGMYSCRRKPDCQTKAGKKKKKYYNSVQYQ